MFGTSSDSRWQPASISERDGNWKQDVAMKFNPNTSAVIKASRKKNLYVSDCRVVFLPTMSELLKNIYFLLRDVFFTKELIAKTVL